MSERSLIDVVDGLTEQLKTSTKDIATSLANLEKQMSTSNEHINTNLLMLTKCVSELMIPSMNKVTAVLEKELPLLRISMSDLQSALKKVFEIQVLPRKMEPKK